MVQTKIQRNCLFEVICYIFWWLLVILKVCVCNMLLKNACRNHEQSVQKTVENGPKMLPKPLRNLEIDPGGGLEATWEPPLCRGDPKTSFLMILAPFWDLIFGSFWSSVFWCFCWGPFGPYFWVLFGDVFGSLFESLRNAWHARKHQFLTWFSHVGAFGKLTFWDTFEWFWDAF